MTLVPEDRIKTGLVGQYVHRGQHHASPRCGADQASAARTAGAPPLRRTATAPTRRRCSSVASRSGELSGGNQQKVLLGAALGPNRPCSILMHPTAGRRHRLQGDDPPDRRGLPQRRAGGPARQRRTRGTRVLRPGAGLGPRPPRARRAAHCPRTSSRGHGRFPPPEPRQAGIGNEHSGTHRYRQRPAQRHRNPGRHTPTAAAPAGTSESLLRPNWPSCRSSSSSSSSARC